MNSLPITLERLHVPVGAACNNFCIFCMEDNRKERYKRISKTTLEDIKEMLDAGKERKLDQVIFTTGEPTMNLEFTLDCLKMAKKNGYKIISLVTNGKRLAYKKVAEILLKSGLNEVILSIHGHNSNIHDGLTRTPGSFYQTRMGLENLNELKKIYSFKLFTDTVINKLNYRYMKEVAKFLFSFKNIDRINFTVLRIEGNAKKFFKILMPRYSEIIKEFKKISKDNERGPVLDDIPFCVAQEIKSWTGNRELWHVAIGNNKNLIKAEVMPGRIKLTKCRECKFYKICEGISEDYFKFYGQNEFQPII